MPVLSKSKLRASQPAALYVPAPGGGGGAVTWSNPTAHVALSGGNLVATATPGVTSGDAARSTTTHSTGKYYVEVVFTNDAGSLNTGVGLVGSTFALGTLFVGGDENSVCFFSGDGTIFYGGSAAAGFTDATSLTTGDVFCIAVNLDVSPRKAWARMNNTIWNGNASGDPAANLLGFDIETLDAAVYLVCDFQDAAGSILTARFNSGSWTYPVPFGYGAW